MSKNELGWFVTMMAACTTMGCGNAATSGDGNNVPSVVGVAHDNDASVADAAPTEDATATDASPSDAGAPDTINDAGADTIIGDSQAADAADATPVAINLSCAIADAGSYTSMPTDGPCNLQGSAAGDCTCANEPSNPYEHQGCFGGCQFDMTLNAVQCLVSLVNAPPPTTNVNVWGYNPVTAQVVEYVNAFTNDAGVWTGAATLSAPCLPQ